MNNGCNRSICHDVLLIRINTQYEVNLVISFHLHIYKKKLGEISRFVEFFGFLGFPTYFKFDKKELETTQIYPISV